ncbi:hypothetical protein Tco_0730469 [Tanacetum coccineum]|uniref:Uncharacterized protein n=1 Tax=Tanacetum coccineum TaxID=301880 RepID=A0ABQ4YVD0_9ASTR
MCTGRICISTKSQEFLSEKIYVDIHGESFEVQVKELDDVLEALQDTLVNVLDRLWSDQSPILLHCNKSDFGPEVVNSLKHLEDNIEDGHSFEDLECPLSPNSHDRHQLEEVVSLDDDNAQIEQDKKVKKKTKKRSLNEDLSMYEEFLTNASLVKYIREDKVMKWLLSILKYNAQDGKRERKEQKKLKRRNIRSIVVPDKPPPFLP